MAKTNKKVIAIASKKGTQTSKKAPVSKKDTKTIVPKKEEEKNVDVKAKETVDKLLEGIPTDINDLKKSNQKSVETNVEMDKDDTSNMEWLQDQLDKLTNENNDLQIKVSQYKSNYDKLFEEYNKFKNNPNTMMNEGMLTDYKAKISELFIDAQRNYLGQNQNRTPYANMKINVLLNRLLENFSFLEEYKRF